MLTIFSTMNQEASRTKNIEGMDIKNELECLEKINLGGVDQWILIRGRNRYNPLLLCLHGGPGTAQIAFAPSYQSELEKRFVVINWDQRGAGKSFSKDVPVESMTISQLASDTCELVEALLKRFNRQKMFLLGHSWGSVLGMLTIQNCPSLFYAYIGLGQVVNLFETGRILYQFLIEAAYKDNNSRAIKELEAIGFPPKEKTSDNIMKQIKWAEKFGGIYNKPGFKKKVIKTILLSHEYSLQEKINYNKASSFCFNSIIYQLLEVNLIEQVPEVKIPIYFFVGKKDYNTPFELTEKYYNNIIAPKKQIFWFDNSAHAPHFEEPESFSSLLVEKVLPEVHLN